jgi:hypothetical protein
VALLAQSACLPICWIEGICFDVVNDFRPAKECAGVVQAGEACEQGELERARLRSLVRATANVHVIPSNGRTQKKSMEFQSYTIGKDVYG